MRIKIFLSIVGGCLISGGIGVYAGTVIDQYQTPRGNMATVEQEQIHKNRIGITVDGRKISKDTWYANGASYAPLRDVAEILGATVNYNSSTMSADIKSASIKGDAAPDNILGIYKGTYTTLGKVLNLTLTIKSEKAYFNFYTPFENTGTSRYANGEYEMNYQYDKETGFIKLNQENWIKRPNNYRMVDIMGGLNHEYLNGSILDGNNHVGQVTVKKVQ